MGFTAFICERILRGGKAVHLMPFIRSTLPLAPGSDPKLIAHDADIDAPELLPTVVTRDRIWLRIF